jgi:hypothetical protein
MVADTRGHRHQPSRHSTNEHSQWVAEAMLYEGNLDTVDIPRHGGLMQKYGLTFAGSNIPPRVNRPSCC